MKALKIKKGRGRGSLSLKATLESMNPGDVFTTSVQRFNYDYIRTRASQVGRQTGRQFSTSHTIEMGQRITITRTK